MPLLDTRIEGKNLVGKFIADVVLQVLSFAAESESEIMKQRQAKEIRMAKLRGIKFGMPAVKTLKAFMTVVDLYEKKIITSGEVCKMSILSRGTFYRMFKKNK